MRQNEWRECITTLKGVASTRQTGVNLTYEINYSRLYLNGQLETHNPSV